MSTDGKHKVTVTIEDPGGTDAALAWAKATYTKLMRSENGQPTSAPEQVNHDLQPSAAPICAIHQVPMARMNGRKGPFWSCHEKNTDGSWCNYRPDGR